MIGMDAKYISSHEFSVEDNQTDKFVIGKKVKTNCGVDGFRYGVVASSVWIGGDTTASLNLEADHLTANLKEVWYEDSPHMNDGRPIIRSDTRPLDSETFFTCSGDSIDNIGDGVKLRWDFSDSTSNVYTSSEIPAGFKAKEILLSFHCPVYLKDGAVYFFDAPWGSYLEMDIVVPSGGYYPNPTGQIPASALGLSGNKIYAQASGNTRYQKYVNEHHIHGDCPMGDELNAEGAAVNPVPPGWYLRGLIFTPENDNQSRGYASMEMYRCHTCLLPGQTIENIH